MAALMVAVVLVISFNPCFAPSAHAAVMPCCPHTDVQNIDDKLCSPLMQLQRDLPEATAPPVAAPDAAVLPCAIATTEAVSIAREVFAQVAEQSHRRNSKTIHAPPLRVLHCVFLI